MLLPEVREGVTEKEVADLLEANMRRCGATGASFPPIVAVGSPLGLASRTTDRHDPDRR